MQANVRLSKELFAYRNYNRGFSQYCQRGYLIMLICKNIII